MLLTTTLLSALLITAPGDGTCSSSQAALVSYGGQDIVETAVAAGSFNTLAAALKAADLVGALQGGGPFTVFAPTDEAFAKLPKEQLAMLLEPKNKALLQAILTYHVVSGEMPAREVLKNEFATTLNGQRINFSATDAGVMVDGAMVLKTDIECSNGIIHVIDTVILPSTNDIVATAVEAGSFKTLAAALTAAQLIETLQGDGPFTVFAPTDDAFAALPEGTVESLLLPENRAKLSAVLTYHVVPGRIYADTVAAGHEFKTVQGQSLKSRTQDKTVYINGARVVRADIETSNGVIHVIDSVLLPQ
jgi:transforming growth factor-beta-induced protein